MGLVHAFRLLNEEEVLSLLDAERGGWRGDREGWVTIEHDGLEWRVHYRRGRLLEVGWWGMRQAGIEPATSRSGGARSIP